MNYHDKFNRAIHNAQVAELQRQDAEIKQATQQAQVAALQRQLAAVRRQIDEFNRATHAAIEQGAAANARIKVLEAEKEARLKSAADYI